MSIPQRTSVLLLVLLGPQGLAAQPQVSPFTSPVTGPNQSLLGIGQPNISGDLNGDGRDEVFAAGSNAIGWVMAGPGGVYGPPNVMFFPGGTVVRLNAVTDLTADGYADLLVTTQNLQTSSTSVRIYPGDGTGSVLPPLFLPDHGVLGFCPGPDEAFVVEVVPNGRPEILLAHCTGIFPNAFELRMLVHDPSVGGWTASGPFSLVPGAASTVDAVGDLNGDGYPDLIGRAWPGSGGTLFVVTGIPNAPFFAGPLLIFPRPFPLSVTGGPVPLVADMNGDGADDVVMGDTVEPGLGPPDIRVATAFGDAQAVLQPWTGFSPINPRITGWGGTGGGLYLEDFDLDGTPDLVQFTVPVGQMWTPHDVEFLRGRPDGTFAPPMVLANNNPPEFNKVTIADADGDGDLDLVCGFTPTTTVAFNESLVGSGAPAQGGTVPRLTRGRAELGNGGFFVGLEQAPPSSPVLLAASLGRLDPIPPSGIALDLTTLLWPLGAPGPATTDPDGRALQPLPLPADPALNGAAAYFQWVVASSNPQGFALSKAARIVLGW